MSNSAESIVKLSRSKQRYVLQDRLLRAFVSMPGSTAKEVAKSSLLGWSDEQYTSSSKRASDLASSKLGYLELTGDRVCKITGCSAHTYRVTERGLDYLRSKGLLVVPKPIPSVRNEALGRESLSALRDSLAQG